MSGDGQLQLQKAVYTALNTALTPTKVYDFVPQDANFPYVVIGEGSASDFDTTTELGQEHRLDLHVFTRDRGKVGCRRVMKQVYDAIHGQALSMDAGAALVYIYFQFSSVSLDEDGLTYHGVIQFNAVTTEA